jgi:hypothetical protein
VGVDKIFKIIKLKLEVIGMSKEVEKKDALEKLELIEKALPKIKKLAKEGKITPVPYEEMVVIDALIDGVFSVSIKESTVIFHLCKYDLPKID